MKFDRINKINKKYNYHINNLIFIDLLDNTF